MPHIILEHSRSLSDSIDIAELLGKLHREVGATESFELDRVKSRAVPLDTVIVGGEAEPTLLLHATVVFSAGRTAGLRKKLGDRMLRLLHDAAEGTGAPGTISRTLEIRQFEEEMYFR